MTAEIVHIISSNDNHISNLKWSTYLASLYQFLFEELGQNRKMQFERTKNTLAFTIDND